MERTYQVFISYKSCNANVARLVSEALVANEVSVWFAEFEVLLENYHEFQQAIDSGIDQCRYAILFTNTDWAKSKYFQVEVARLMQRLPAVRILRVEIPVASEPNQLREWVRREILQHSPVGKAAIASPAWVDDVVRQVQVPRALWPVDSESRLEHSPAMQWTNRLEDVLSFVREHSDLLPQKFAVPSSSTGRLMRHWRNRATGLTVDLGGFSPRVNTGNEILTAESVIGMFDANLDGDPCAMFIQYLRDASVVSDITPPLGQLNDDRVLYSLFREYAQGWSEAEGCTVKGLHLVMASDADNSPIGRIAITYTTVEHDGQPESWERRYVIPLQSDVTAETGVADRILQRVVFGRYHRPQHLGEVGVIFRMMFPHGDVHRHRQQFFSHCRSLEAVVRSLAIEPPPRWNDVSITFLAIRILLACSAVWAWVELQNSAAAPGWIAASACLAGMLLIDVLWLWFPTVTDIVDIYDLASDRIQKTLSLYERFSNNWYDILWIALIWIGMVGFWGATHPATVLLIAAGLFFHVWSPWYWTITGAAISATGTIQLVRKIRMKSILDQLCPRWSRGTPEVDDAP